MLGLALFLENFSFSTSNARVSAELGIHRAYASFDIEIKTRQLVLPCALLGARHLKHAYPAAEDRSSEQMTGL